MPHPFPRNEYRTFDIKFEYGMFKWSAMLLPHQEKYQMFIRTLHCIFIHCKGYSGSIYNAEVVGHAVAYFYFTVVKDCSFERILHDPIVSDFRAAWGAGEKFLVWPTLRPRVWYSVSVGEHASPQ